MNKIKHSVAYLAIIAATGCASTQTEELSVMSSAQPEPTVIEDQPLIIKQDAILPSATKTYTVVKGDTLWDIAAKLLNDPWKWPGIWSNNAYVRNPHLIFPGDVLALYYIDGIPVIGFDGRPVTTAKGKTYYPTVKLHPQIRKSQLKEAIPTIKPDVIAPFLMEARVLDEDSYKNAPYVVAGEDRRLMSGEKHNIYVRGIGDTPQAHYAVMRKGKPYYNPKNKDELLGYEAIYLGSAKIKQAGDPAIFTITDSKKEILTGDRLIAADDSNIQDYYYPRKPKEEINGQIISIVDGLNRAGLYQTVVLDIGRQEGIERGHVLTATTSGQPVLDAVSEEMVKLPDEKAGKVMVFRVFERVSYAIIVESTRSVSVGNAVTSN